MPVHSAGPRLYKSVKFKHLVRKHGSGAGGRATNIYLNMTPFVDLMTCLVSFLLMVFSSTGTLLQAQKGLELPIAESRDTLQIAPVITVTKDQITFQGEGLATVESVLRDDSPTFKIDALFEKLQAKATEVKADIDGGKLTKDLQKACEEAKQGIRPLPGHVCPDGLAILQADESTDARLINKIVNTAKAAGFDNLLFAVKNK
ncbi:MAG TPA: biopolymer transporter ExbD [Kofleriaceae bacterium]|nr:biopolymer transporter ExbD [Kofleriaceae bacterium]